MNLLPGGPYRNQVMDETGSDPLVVIVLGLDLIISISQRSGHHVSSER
jgi:hypothetical protein